MSRLWTIGHSTLTRDTFIADLRAQDIAMLVDVRRYPGSRRLPWTERTLLAEALAGQGIGYVHMPALGGRRSPVEGSPHTAWRSMAFRGYADHMDTPAFNTALEKLKEIANAHPAAIMCAEALWWNCHRGLIADRLKADGWTVLHIRGNTVTEHPYTAAARIVDGRLSYTEPTLL